MKKIITCIFALFTLTFVSAVSPIKAESVTVLRAAPCGHCGSMSVSTVPGYTTEWQDYEGDYCIHGYSNGYDMGQLRWVYSAYKKCSNCGWQSEQTVKQEGRRVCYGY